MRTIKLFYGSSTGNTEHVAELMKDELGEELAVVASIANATLNDISTADSLILGVPTWDDGQLQEDWEEFFPNLDKLDLRGKKVALFGLGDAQGFSGEFANALAILYAKIKERGAQIVGSWPTAGYKFDYSAAAEGEQFVGLVLDEDNEPQKTKERVRRWLQVIRRELLSE